MNNYCNNNFPIIDYSFRSNISPNSLFKSDQT